MPVNEAAIPSGNYKNLTASGIVDQGACSLLGFYVNSTSTGTIKFFDGQDTGGTAIGGTITPAIGWHFYPAAAKSALFASIGSTLDVTIIYA